MNTQEITTILQTLKATEDMLKSARKKLDECNVLAMDSEERANYFQLWFTCVDYERQIEGMKQGFAKSHGLVLNSEN